MKENLFPIIIKCENGRVIRITYVETSMPTKEIAKKVKEIKQEFESRRLPVGKA